MPRQLGLITCTEMVRAFLDGRKRQARRIIKNMPEKWHIGKCAFEKNGNGDESFIIYGKCGEKTRYAPYRVGDELYIKEAWRIGSWNENEGTVCIDYKADGYCRQEWLQVPDEDDFVHLWVQCSEDCRKAGLVLDIDNSYHWHPGESPCRWRSSRFMFKAFARLWYRVKAVKDPQRLQDISEEDAEHEGCEYFGGYPIDDLCPRTTAGEKSEIEVFQTLWDSLHKPGERWADNPYVFPYELEELEKKEQEKA